MEKAKKRPKKRRDPLPEVEIISDLERMEEERDTLQTGRFWSAEERTQLFEFLLGAENTANWDQLQKNSARMFEKVSISLTFTVPLLIWR